MIIIQSIAAKVMHMKSIAQTLLYLVLPVALIRFVHSHQLECQGT